MVASRYLASLLRERCKRLKNLALHIAKGLGLFALSRFVTRRQLRILCYHGVWLGGDPHYGDCLYMDAERFNRRIRLLARLPYPVLALDEALERLSDGTLPPCAVAITIDDAWYSTYARMLPVLKRYGMPATIYVTTYYVVARRPVLNVLTGYMVQRAAAVPDPIELFTGDSQSAARARDASREELADMLSTRIDRLPDLDARYKELMRIAELFAFDLDAVIQDRRFDLMSEDEIRSARALGFDIQLHTHTHRMHGFDPERVIEDVERNRGELARILAAPGAQFVHFCYPSGVHDEGVFAVLERAGVRSATTTDFGLNGPRANPMALRRILDCQSLSDIELEARLCGLWSLRDSLRSAARRERRLSFTGVRS